MMTLVASLAGSFAPLIIWLIKSFISNKDKQIEMIKSFHSFLDAADKSVEEKVNSQLSLKRARRKKQMELLEEKRLRDSKNVPK